MEKEFISLIAPPQASASDLWVILQGETVLMQKKVSGSALPSAQDIATLQMILLQQQYLGQLADQSCYAAEIQGSPALSSSLEWIPIRQAYKALDTPVLAQLIARAKQILYWDRQSKYCGCCGALTLQSQRQRAKECPDCQALVFPMIAPAMMVLIWRDDTILLARAEHFLPEVYSVLAGFVEPGETLEQTVIREVKEEVGLQIQNIKYFGSQPWPFPSNLMLAFTAEYHSGEIQVDKNELEDAQWFSIHQLPKLPQPISLSRAIIDAHIKNNLTD